MKRFPLLTIIIVVSLLLTLPGCEKENVEIKDPKIETLSAEKGQSMFVVSLSGRVSELEDVALDFECGIEYSTVPLFFINKTIRQKVEKKYSEDPFTITINRVNPDQKYYYRAYYINQSKLYYGEVKDFTFTWDAPQVTTLSAELVDLNKVKIYGQIEGLEKILKNYQRSNVYYGIQYSTSENFESSYIYYANRDNSQIGDTIEYELPYFRYNTKYYYRTFFFLYFEDVISDNMLSMLYGKSDIYYGDVKDFTFTWDAPKVTTLSVELSRMNGEVLVCKGLMNGFGDIVKNYSDSTLRYGILYSTSESFDANSTRVSYSYPYDNQMGDTIVSVIFHYHDDYSEDYGYKYNTDYYYRAFFYYRGIFEEGETKTFKVTPLENGFENGYQYIELGLSVKWASFNVGATKPEEYGDYFAWGETEPFYEAGYAQENPQAHWKHGKSNGYNWSTYKWCKGSSTTLTKYCTNSDFGNNGFTDTKTILEPEDDVAHVKWGGSWRMPTQAEQTELMRNCNWTWYESGNTEFNGVVGFKISSNIEGYTDRYIFLPAAGWRYNTILYNNGSGFYWSSSFYFGNPNWAHWQPSVVPFLVINCGDMGWSFWARDNGLSVRPVCP